MTKRYEESAQNIIDKFNILYYDSNTWRDTRWFGVPVQKIVSDLWVYQEIIFDIKPDIIIETGTYDGGSALFMATMCDIIGKGKVITIDTDARQKTPHGSIYYILGSSISDDVLSDVKKHIKPNDNVMVILDSNHEKSHVLKEMMLYWEFVSIGSYLIVEDTNLGGNPVYPAFGPGPKEAVEEFLRMEIGRKFVPDYSREKFFITWNPGGYLKRVQ